MSMCQTEHLECAVRASHLRIPGERGLVNIVLLKQHLAAKQDEDNR